MAQITIEGGAPRTPQLTHQYIDSNFTELYNGMGITQTFRATGAAALAATLAPGEYWRLEEIRVTLSAAGGSGDLTATLDHSEGAVYDVTLLTRDMTAVTSFIWTPERPMEFLAGDELDIAWANAGTVTYGLEIVYKVI